MRVVRYGLVLCAVLWGGVASGQTVTAYQSGLSLARSRGYENPECYARVFAKHAVVVEKGGGRRGWFAPSTPAYNAEQRARCGIDRLTDMAARREAQRFAAPGAPRIRGGLYGAGLRVAAERGYSGADAACFAKTYAVYATPQPAPSGQVKYAIPGASHRAYAQELFGNCRISR